VSTFGLTISDAKARLGEMLSGRKTFNRSPMTVASLARVTLSCDEQLVLFDANNHWQDLPETIQSASIAPR
jgi:hypothetical protein